MNRHQPLTPTRHPGVRVIELEGKGRGLLAAQALAEDEVLDAAPVIPLRHEDLPPSESLLHGYAFDWPDPPFLQGLALGIISLVNHSDTPNAWFEPDIPNKLIRLYALRDISAGEEITIDYGIPLWFDAKP